MRVTENFTLNNLVYYGDYIIDSVYDINKFLINDELNFFKCCQYQEGKKSNSKIGRDRYVIITDVYFLLFDPEQNSRNYGKLLFWGDIRQLLNNKPGYIAEEKLDSVILEWKNGNEVQISFELVFKDSTIEEFLNITKSKIEKITNKFKMFQDDISKSGDQINSYTYANKDYLVNLIALKEKLLRRTQSIFIINELISLYQKIIEILSEKNDMDYKMYLEKLHALLNNKDVQDKIGEESETSSHKALNNY